MVVGRTAIPINFNPHKELSLLLINFTEQDKLPHHERIFGSIEERWIKRKNLLAGENSFCAH
jgi:hypothetical protein